MFKLFRAETNSKRKKNEYSYNYFKCKFSTFPEEIAFAIFLFLSEFLIKQKATGSAVVLRKYVVTIWLNQSVIIAFEEYRSKITLVIRITKRH